MLYTEDHQQFLKKQTELYKLYLQKNKCYGNCYKDYGAIGIIIRMNDKINRLRTITNHSVNIDCGDESLKDTLRDLGNYAVLALMEIDRLEREQDDIHN